MNREATEEEKIFDNHLANKELAYRIAYRIDKEPMNSQLIKK